MERIICVAALAALTACAAPTYSPPTPTASQVAAAESGAASFVLTRHDRDQTEEVRLLRRAEQRIRSAAARVCPEIADGHCSFSVRIEASDLPNAYVDESGDIRITDGLIRFLEREDEVAFVIAHEFAHRMANHAEEGSRNARIGSALAAIALAGVAAATGGGALLAVPAFGLGLRAGEHLAVLDYTKEQEREADYLGAYLLAIASYDVASAGRVMENLAALEVQHPAHDDGRGLGFFATHPSSPERVASMALTLREIDEKRERRAPMLPGRPEQEEAGPL